MLYFLTSFNHYVLILLFPCKVKVKVKLSRYRPGVARRVGRGIHLQEAGWAPWPVWTGGKSRPHRDSIPDRPARSQSLYRLLLFPCRE